MTLICVQNKYYSGRILAELPMTRRDNTHIHNVSLVHQVLDKHGNIHNAEFCEISGPSVISFRNQERVRGLNPSCMGVAGLKNTLADADGEVCELVKHPLNGLKLHCELHHPINFRIFGRFSRVRHETRWDNE